MKKLAKIFEGNWDEIKGKMQTQWGELTDDDLEQINGSYEELIGKLEKLYGHKLVDLEKEIADFFDSDNFEKVNATKLIAVDQDFMAKANHLKDVVKDAVAEQFEIIKDKTSDFEENVTAYCKANPLKAVGMVALAGFAFGALFSKLSN